MYSVSDYGAMIGDKVRMEAYAEALKRSVKPGHVVVDVGCGTGIFALIACKLGAGHVYAIESNPCIEFARRCAVKNGFADRITFFDAKSTDVALPELADVLVSDLRGSPHHVSSVIDARTRFLKPGGAQLPQRDALVIAPVDAPDLYASLTAGSSFQGIDLSPCREAVVNTQQGDYANRISASRLIAQPEAGAQLDYATLGAPRAGGSVVFTSTRAGLVHGFAGWFDTLLCEGIGYSTAPGSPVTAYSTTLLALPEPVAVVVGTQIEVRVQLVEHPVDGPTFGWTTCFDHGVQFKQSSLGGRPIRAASLRAHLQADRSSA